MTPGFRCHTHSPRPRVVAGSLWIAAIVALTLPARADLDSDARKLVASLSVLGPALRLAPRLVERSSGRPLALPHRSLRPGAHACLTVIVLGVPTTTFALRFLAVDEDSAAAASARPQRSVAGLAQLTRCHDERQEFAHLAVEMRSPRAVLEVVLVETREPGPEASAILPQRQGGPAPHQPSDPRPHPAPLASRLSRLAERRVRLGSVEERALVRRAGDTGGGSELVQLEAGCHRLHALTEAAPQEARRSVDLDLEVLAAPSGQPLASDQGHAPDATVDFCRAKAGLIAVRYVGALPRTEVHFVIHRWDLPRGLPAGWGAYAVARAAEALHDVGTPLPDASPVAQSIGVTGATRWPLALVPGACYIAVVAALGPSAGGVELRYERDAHVPRFHGGPFSRSATLAFCADDARPSALVVEAQGSGVAWVGGLWPVAWRGLDEAAP